MTVHVPHQSFIHMNDTVGFVADATERMLMPSVLEPLYRPASLVISHSMTYDSMGLTLGGIGTRGLLGSLNSIHG